MFVLWRMGRERGREKGRERGREEGRGTGRLREAWREKSKFIGYKLGSSLLFSL